MEPVLLGLAPAAITAAITAIVNVLNAFGIITVTKEQLDALNQAAIAIMVILGALGAWYGRSKVTPVVAPTLPTGTSVTVTNPDPAIADVKVNV